MHAAAGERPRGGSADAPTRAIDRGFGWFFRPFNRAFDGVPGRYGSVVRSVARRSAVAQFVYGGLVGLGVLGFDRVPDGLVPTHDKQSVVAIAQLPDAASLDRTEAVVRPMGEIARSLPGVYSAMQFAGLSVIGFANKPNAAIIFLYLAPFGARRTESESAGFQVLRQ